MTLSPQDNAYLRLLELGPFDRRASGGWRFGTKVISDVVVERLIAGGFAKRENDRVHLLRTALPDDGGR